MPHVIVFVVEADTPDTQPATRTVPSLQSTHVLTDTRTLRPCHLSNIHAVQGSSPRIEYRFKGHRQRLTSTNCKWKTALRFSRLHKLNKEIRYLQDKQCTCNVISVARSRDHSCRRKAVSIKYYECASVDLRSMQTLVPYCQLWSVWLFHIFRHYLTNGTILGGKCY